MTDLDREENARILISHLQIKPEFFPHDGSTISGLERMVSRVMDEQPITIITNEDERLRISAELRAALKDLEPDDQAICKNCSYPYEEHALIGSFCPNVWDEDSDWSLTWRFAQ